LYIEVSSKIRAKSCAVCSDTGSECSGPSLHYVKCIIEHLSYDPNAHTYQVHLYGTFTDSAKKAAYMGLGHPKESFESFVSEQDYWNVQEWPYDTAVFLRARAESGEIFTVEIETEPNNARLTGDASSTVRGSLCHFLQQTIHYSEYWSGCKRKTSADDTFRT
jgi:hypothetical protein